MWLPDPEISGWDRRDDGPSYSTGVQTPLSHWSPMPHCCLARGHFCTCSGLQCLIVGGKGVCVPRANELHLLGETRVGV